MRRTRRNALLAIGTSLLILAAMKTTIVDMLKKITGENPLPFTPTDTKAIKHQFDIGFQWPTLDPFLFCAYHKDDYPQGNDQLGPQGGLAGRNLGMDFQVKDGFRMYHGQTVPGFPGHPHRGFETVTIVRQGTVDHADSLGAAGRYGAGDVQWMTAGRGIQHSEMFPLLEKSQRNPLELFQVWLNLPRQNKFVEPHFKMFWSQDIERLDKDGVKVDIVAGALPFGRNMDLTDRKEAPPPPNSWANKPENHVAIWVIDLAPNAKFKLPTVSEEAKVNRMLYFHSGDSLLLGGRKVSPGQGFELDASLPLSLENAATGKSHSVAQLLLLQGRPIAEPVVKHGPFVMNTKEEIQQAIADYRRTRFGGWPWKRDDVVHDQHQGRFALHPNGERDEPA